MIDALFVEYAFACFFRTWPRTGLIDADVFRRGAPKDQGELLHSLAQRLASRGNDHLKVTHLEAM